MPEDKKFETVSEKVDRNTDLQIETNAKLDAILVKLEKEEQKKASPTPTPINNVETDQSKRRKILNYVISTSTKSYGFSGSKKQFLFFKYLIIALFALLMILCVVNTTLGYTLLNGYQNISYIDFIFVIYTAIFCYPIILFGYKTDVTRLLSKSRAQDIEILNKPYPQGYLLKKWKIMCICFPILELLLIFACTVDAKAMLVNIILLCIELVIGVALYFLFVFFVRKYMAIIYDGKLNNDYIGFIYDPMECGAKFVEIEEYIKDHPEREEYRG